MNTADLHSLIQRLIDGEISAEDFAVLEKELLEHPDALAAYRLYTGIHCGLERQAELTSAIRHAPVVPIDKVMALQRRRVVNFSLMAAAAVLMISATVLWIISVPEAPPTMASLRSAPGSVVSLSHSGDEGGSGTDSLNPGSTVRLDHGALEIDLPHDVRALIEAPARLTLIDDRTLGLDHGRGFFEVPTAEGHGFTVVTPHQRIVDLGTAFGIDAPADRDELDLHVLEGRVRIDALGGEAGEVIAAPRSVALGGTDILKEVKKSSHRFRRQLPEKVHHVLVEDFESGLRAACDYAIHMDPTAIRDQAGNRLAGISEKNPWRFSTSKELQIRNPGFETDDPVNKAPLHWREVSRVPVLFNTYTERPKATEGSRRLLVPPDSTVVQDLGAPIRAGSTYQLILDAGNCPARFPSQAVVQFYGSDAGHEAPLAEIRLDPAKNAWLRSQTLIFSATPKEATGQTLGIALCSKDGFSSFDDLRIIETRGVDQVESTGVLAEEGKQSGQPDTSSPLISSFDPAPVASDAPFDRIPTLVFNEPVRFGTGRIIVQNLTDRSETELVVGSGSTSLRGRVLTFLPPLGLEEGATQTGAIPGWECSGAVSRFSPSGSGQRYRHPDLADDSKARGILDSMKGPTLVSLGMRGQLGSIRRSLGNVEGGRTYTVSVGIGCRSHDTAYTSPFAGYRIRLLCDSVVLAGVSGQSPPGPPDSVMPVGFSWDSSEFPGHLAADAPLVLEISSLGDANDDGGSLDLDHVQVTSVGGVGR